MRPKLVPCVALALTAIVLTPVAAKAETPTGLQCIEDQLDLGQRAAIGKLFAEPSKLKAAERGEEQNASRRLGEGTVKASANFASVIGSCAERFNWNDTQRRMAEDYLIELGNISLIAFRHGEQWNDAMERYARFGVTKLPQEGETNEHLRAVLAAGAHANGVPTETSAGYSTSDIIAYLRAYRKLQESITSFPS